MITQFGVSGISMILDKSAFQAFSSDELSQLRQYFSFNVTPILVMEVLGDLRKENTEGTYSSKRVIEFSAKLSTVDNFHNALFSTIICEELLGSKIDFFYPVVDSGEVMVTTEGKKVVKIYSTVEKQALDRWKEGNFTEVDNLISQYWRTTTTKPDILITLKRLLEKEISDFKVLKTQAEIDNHIALAFQNPKLHLTFLELLIEEFPVPLPAISEVFYRWETFEKKSLTHFAPYSFFCLRVKLLFNICLLNDIINTRPTNLLDLQYLYYLPFCEVFVSDDKFHKQLAPYLLTSNQRFATGQELKNDLKKIKEIKATLSENELKRVFRHPPPVLDLLIFQLWNELRPNWQTERDWIPSDAEMAMFAKAITDFRGAKPLA